MASRKYQRDSHGRFAGSGRAVSTTVGRAGGFANTPHREKAVQARRSAAKRRRRNTMLRKGAGAVVGLAATAALGGALSRGMKTGSVATQIARQINAHP